MALAIRQDDLFAPYRSGAFATARRRVRQAAFGYCATPDREAYERMIRPMMMGLADAPRALPGPAEGSAAAEALIDGIVLRKLLFDASEPGRCSGHHLETFRHGIWGLDGMGSCAGRLDPGHDHCQLNLDTFSRLPSHPITAAGIAAPEGAAHITVWVAMPSPLVLYPFNWRARAASSALM